MSIEAMVAMIFETRVVMGLTTRRIHNTASVESTCSLNKVK